MTRRDWLATMAAAAAWSMAEANIGARSGGSPASGEGQSPVRSRAATDAVDHLLLGAPDLDAAIAWFESRTGVKAIPGGSHPGRGTRNALVSLGRRHYLEIIAPDPAQKDFNFQIDVRKLASPRLITWAASSMDLASEANAAAKAGLKVFGPQDGSRAKPDGTTLHWRTLGVESRFGDGAVDPVPFFIEWGKDVKHPSEDSPAGCRLVSMEFGHPSAPALRGTLAQLGIEATVTTWAAPRIVAILDTPKGKVGL